MQFTRLHLHWHTSGADRHPVTMSRKALFPFAMTNGSESCWVVRTRVCAAMAFPSITPHCADNTMTMTVSDNRGLHLVPWNRRVLLRTVQFHSRKSSGLHCKCDPIAVAVSVKDQHSCWPRSAQNHHFGATESLLEPGKTPFRNCS